MPLSEVKLKLVVICVGEINQFTSQELDEDWKKKKKKNTL